MCVQDSVLANSKILVLCFMWLPWLAREWTKAQQAYYKISKSLRSGRRWTIELIKKLWDVTRDLWEHRNNILHKTQNVVNDQSSCSLNCWVLSAYTDLQSLLLKAHDRHLLVMKLSHLLKKDTLYKEVWLCNAQSVFQGNSHEGKNQSLNNSGLQGMHRRMKLFLLPWSSKGNP